MSRPDSPQLPQNSPFLLHMTKDDYGQGRLPVTVKENIDADQVVQGWRPEAFKQAQTYKQLIKTLQGIQESEEKKAGLITATAKLYKPNVAGAAGASAGGAAAASSATATTTTTTTTTASAGAAAAGTTHSSTQKVSITIREQDCLKAAQEIKAQNSGKKVAILDMANLRSVAGGAMQGAYAQEEQICAVSDLLVHLINYVREFHVANNSTAFINPRNGRLMFPPMASDAVLYASDVNVYAQQNRNKTYSPLDQSFQVDMVASAAVIVNRDKSKLRADGKGYETLVILDHDSSNWKQVSVDDYERIMKQKMRRQIESAIDNDVDVLILSAFGCGAFTNSPTQVAALYGDVIQEMASEINAAGMRIEFSVLGRSNVQAFAECFDNADMRKIFDVANSTQYRGSPVTTKVAEKLALLARYHDQPATYLSQAVSCFEGSKRASIVFDKQHDRLVVKGVSVVKATFASETRYGYSELAAPLLTAGTFSSLDKNSLLRNGELGQITQSLSDETLQLDVSIPLQYLDGLFYNLGHPNPTQAAQQWLDSHGLDPRVFGFKKLDKPASALLAAGINSLASRLRSGGDNAGSDDAGAASTAAASAAPTATQ